MLGFLNFWEIVLVIAVVFFLFGARRIPDLARGIGQSIKEFKKGVKDEQPASQPPRKQS